VGVTELARNLISFMGFCVHEFNRQVLKLENMLQTPAVRFNMKQLLTNTAFFWHKLSKVATQRDCSFLTECFIADKFLYSYYLRGRRGNTITSRHLVRKLIYWLQAS
jgi:hypothetical protein